MQKKKDGPEQIRHEEEVRDILRMLVRTIRHSVSIANLMQGAVYARAQAIVEKTYLHRTPIRWTRFERRVANAITPDHAAAVARATGQPLAAVQAAVGDAQDVELWANSIYQVAVRRGPDSAVHLSIKRTDNAPVRDWRDLQRIKDELIGPECEAMELYPARSRLVDSANQFHLWGFSDPSFRFPVGFTERLVADDDPQGPGMQRPFETE